MTSQTFFIEESPTPIFQRIIKCITYELRKSGHNVLMEKGPEDGNLEHYKNRLIELCPDFLLLANSYCQLYKSFGPEGEPLFEVLGFQLIFLHHDNLCSHARTQSDAVKTLNSYIRAESRSHHFCVEYKNYLDLRDLGIRNAYPILHSCEIPEGIQFKAANGCRKYNLSFVGHVVAVNAEHVISHLPFSHLILADYYGRMKDLTHRIEPSAEEFADLPSQSCSNVNRMATKYFFHSCVHATSQRFRGDLIARLDRAKIDIFGGDPRSYLHARETPRNIRKESVRYHPPTSSALETASVYSSSKISLNITALQFDQAVTNRVLDIGACSGFPLTDWKQDLEKITSVAQEISYKSLDELKFKIEYFLHSDHVSERNELAEVFQKDVISKCTYSHLVNTILESISRSSAMTNDPQRIDLGCGFNKASGFVGVDRFPHQLIDIVADLNQRFPFAANSVEVVRAHDALEHLRDPIHTMNEIWRICHHNALVDIRVPSTDGRGAFQDPTHISFWNRHSFNYYCVEYPAYLCLCRSYGFDGSFRLESLHEDESSDGVIHVHAFLRALKPGKDLTKKYSLRSINTVIDIAANGMTEERLNWQFQLRELLIAVCQSPYGSEHCFVLDHSELDADEFTVEAGAAMLEVMLCVPSPPSGNYPGVSLLPAPEDPDRELILSMVSERVCLQDYTLRFSSSSQKIVING